MTDNDYKLLDRYLAGELTAEEQAQVQTRLEQDTDFAEAHRFRDAAERYLRTQAAEPALREVLAKLGPQHFGEEQPPEQSGGTSGSGKVRRLWPTLLAIAAAVALLLLAWRPWAEADLYTQYAEHRPLALVEKSAGTDLAARAEAAFNTEDYETAYKLLQDYLETDTGSLAAKLALGIAALETDRIGEAIVRFQTMSKTATSYQSTARWYLALSQLKGDQRGLARATLGLLLDDPTYGPQARELREALE